MLRRQPELSVGQLVSHSCLCRSGFVQSLQRALLSCPLVPTVAILLQSGIFPHLSNFTSWEMEFNCLSWALSLLAIEVKLEFLATEFPVSYLISKDSVPSLLLQNTLYLAVIFLQ